MRVLQKEINSWKRATMQQYYMYIWAPLIITAIPEFYYFIFTHLIYLKKIIYIFLYIKIFKNKKYNSKNTHGTGCTLSSAIATYLSCGKDLIKSCELGIKYVNDAIKSNLNLGKGKGPINHLNSISVNSKFN